MNSLLKFNRKLLLLSLTALLVHVQAQQSNVVLQDTSILSQATFTSFNSITAGPNLHVSETGDLTLITREQVYFKPGLMVVGAGKLQTINDQNIINDIKPQLTQIPDKFRVQQNYPNPFNPTTLIRYDLPDAQDVSIVVYNALGQAVRTLLSARQPAGNYSVTWDARNGGGVIVSSGTYYYMVKAGQFTTIKKMVFLK